MQVKRQQLESDMDWVQTGKGVHQGCIFSPSSFNFYVVYVMKNVGLDESQAKIKISRRNINDFRYANDTSLMTEGEEELKSFLMKLKENGENAGLKFNTQKTKIIASGPNTL